MINKIRVLFYFLVLMLIFSTCIKKNRIIDMEYAKKFEIIKKEYYPFDNWRVFIKEGSNKFTNDNCKKAQVIMDKLIDELIKLGKDSSEKNRVSKFEIAVKKYNKLNGENYYPLIETVERDELCELFYLIAEAAGIDNSKYGGGEGIASEWREW